jgi:Undecaprenyl-phosphate glucose phosphotransferase
MRETTLSRANAAADARAYGRARRALTGPSLIAVSASTDAPLIATAPRGRQRLFHRSAIRLSARVLDAIIALAVTILLCNSAGFSLADAPFAAAAPCLALPAAGVTGVWLAGGYRFRYAGSIIAHLLRIAVGGGLAMAAAYAAATWLHWPTDAGLLAELSLAVAVTHFALHANYLAITRLLTRAGQLSDNVVIVGATEAASRIVLRNGRERELNILGYFDDRIGRNPPPMGDIPFLGGIEELIAWRRLPEVDRIVVTVTSTAQARVKGLIDRLRKLPQEIILVLDLEGFNPEQTSLARIADAPAAYISGAPKDLRRAMIKRSFDLVLTTGLLAVFAMPMLVIAALIKLDSRGPVFFRQKRHGFNNETIRVWKFRTMRPDKRAEEGVIRQTVCDDPRVTRIGRILRQSSLDELPQLFNILVGEMSLVGPRPHAVGMTAEAIEVQRIVGDYAHRHRMKPGLTGWAQINGSRGPVHTAEGVRERVRLDMDYVNRASVWLDLYILAMTAPCLLGDAQRDR